MYCRNCNKEITEEAAFCMYCGAALEVEEEKPQEGIIVEKEEPSEGTNKKSGREGIFAMALILALILLICYGMYQNAPLAKIETAFKDGEVDVANSYFYDLEENDNFGNSYPNSACLTAEEAMVSGTFDAVGKLEYLINGKYNRISGTLAYWGDVYKDYRRGKSHLEIYSDDVLVYTSPTITEDSQPVTFEAQLAEGCHKLTIKLIPENWFDSYVVLGDMKVYNR